MCIEDTLIILYFILNNIFFHSFFLLLFSSFQTVKLMCKEGTAKLMFVVCFSQALDNNRSNINFYPLPLST